MAVRAAKDKFFNEFREIGKRAINAKFPKDFEYYFIAFELVDSDENMIDYFAFPVMPENISEVKTEIKSIKKTAGGITTLKTSNFVPRQITLAGDFGRKFKILQGASENFLFSAVRFSTKDGVFNLKGLGQGLGSIIKDNIFDTRIKTGYGCIKVLEAIIDKAQGVDAKGNPLKLYFYNHALGNNYLVEPMTLNLNQSVDENMIWKYNLQMTAVARLDDLFKDNINKYLRNLGWDYINKKTNKLVNKTKKQFFQNETVQEVTDFIGF